MGGTSRSLSADLLVAGKPAALPAAVARRSPLRSEASIIIDRPIGEVFAYATNPECWPEWVSGVVKVVSDSGSRLDVGSTFGQVDTFPDRRRSEAWECIEYEPPRVLTCRRITGSRPYTLRLECVLVDGRTKLAVCSDAEPDDLLG